MRVQVFRQTPDFTNFKDDGLYETRQALLFLKRAIEFGWKRSSEAQSLIKTPWGELIFIKKQSRLGPQKISGVK